MLANELMLNVTMYVNIITNTLQCFFLDNWRRSCE